MWQLLIGLAAIGACLFGGCAPAPLSPSGSAPVAAQAPSALLRGAPPARPQLPPRAFPGAERILADAQADEKAEAQAAAQGRPDAGAGGAISLDFARRDRRVAYTAADIVWLRVSIWANNAWIYDKFVAFKGKLTAANLPPGWAYVFLMAYDTAGTDIVGNSDGYVYGLAWVDDATVSKLGISLPLL